MHSSTKRQTRLQTIVRVGVIGAAVFSLAACASATEPAGSSGAAEGSSPAAAAIEAVSVIAPADAGGGWDQTARAMTSVLTEADLVGKAQASNIPKAGGTVGLASLATETDPNTLMITGSVMVGAVETNNSEARIEDMTPIARLTEEPLVVVVPADSEFQTAKDLTDAVIADGKSVAITGGSAGGIDHQLVAQMLTEGGLDAAQVGEKLNYVENSGGGEALTSLLSGAVKAGVSGVGEFAESVKSGDLRALAVTSAEPAAGLPDVPTLQDQGIDIDVTNWRGVIAPGGISDEERAALTELVTNMRDSDGWQTVLTSKGWTDAFLADEEFETFLTEDISKTQKALKLIGLLQ